MRILYHPAICWLTRHIADSYDESWEWVLDTFRRSAERYWCNANPARCNDMDAGIVIYEGVKTLQKKLLGQYLPRLDAAKEKSVTWLWGDFGGERLLVELENGRVDDVADPLPEHGKTERRRFADGVEYLFKLYRNDTFEQRERWFRQILRQAARSENPKRKWEPEPMGEQTPEPVEKEDFARRLADRLTLAAMRAIVDREDYERVAFDWHRTTPADDQKKSRALKCLRTAVKILDRASYDEQARAYRDELKQAPDGSKAKILRRYERDRLEKGEEGDGRRGAVA